MKTLFKVIPVILAIAVLAGCSLDGETATIVLSVGQAGGARAVSLSEVSHSVALSGPTGSRSAEIGPGGGSASFTVAPGTWSISVTGYYQGQTYSTGSAIAEVVGGKTTNVSVPMSVVYVEPAPPIVDNRPFLSMAQVDDSGLKSSLLNYLTSSVVGDVVYVFMEHRDLDVTPSTVTWEWQVDGVTVPADLSIDPDGNNYTVQPGDLSKNITVIATHPKYQGSITFGPLLVCQGLLASDWPSFAYSLGSPAFPADGQYVLLEDITSLPPNTIVGGYNNPFKGTLDGNGKTINLNISTASFDGYMGLFALIGPSGIMKNLNINAEIDGSPGMNSLPLYAGVVAGVNQGQIFNVSVVLGSSGVKIQDTYDFIANVGGIVGRNYNIISNCSVDGASSLGILAENNGSSQAKAGGIAGWNEGTIHHCWTVEVNVNCEGPYLNSGGGGIAGNNDGNIQNCVVIGPSNITSIIDPGSVSRIWGTGNVNGSANNYSDAAVLRNGGSVTIGTLNNNGGESISFLEYGDDAWWTGTAGWDSVWGDAWDEAKPWVWGVSNQPVLWFN